MTNENKPNETSRRSFLKLSAAAGAGVLPVGATAAAAQSGPQAGELPPLLPVPEKPGFDHLVVLMFENRSFDNLLGYLYPPDKLAEGQTFDGVANGDYSNPSPEGPIPAHVYTGPTDTIMDSPNPDPGEEYPHVNTQLFGTVDPPGHAHARRWSRSGRHASSR